MRSSAMLAALLISRVGSALCMPYILTSMHTELTTERLGANRRPRHRRETIVARFTDAASPL
jgi:hypothetical protein